MLSPPNPPHQLSPVRVNISNSNPLPTFNSPLEREKHLFKPRHIPRLELYHLQGLDLAASLRMFFAAVEQCTDEDDARVQIAKARVSPELAIMVYCLHRKHWDITWEDKKRNLCSEFAFEMSVDRAGKC